MVKREKLSPKGWFTVEHICKDRNGNIVEFKPEYCDLKPKDVKKWNLVVNSGRQIIAQSLGGFFQDANQAVPQLNRIIVGEGQKTDNLPNLSDTGLVQEITNLSGTPAGTFLLAGPFDASPEITFPPQSQIFPVSGFTGPNASISIDAFGDTIFEDTTVDFGTIGISETDQVTIDNSVSNPLVFGIQEVLSSTQLRLHNPTQFTGSNIAWRIGTPGTQVVVSKLLEGNDFTLADWGGPIVLSEAGILFNNNVLFNRVVFTPENEDVGVLIQSDEGVSGIEISARLTWVITL